MATHTVGEESVRIPVHGKGGKVVAYAMVDKQDAHLARWRWRFDGSGYASRTISKSGKKRTVLMHREVLGLVHGDGIICDHKDRVRLNNRRSNLRKADASINSSNRRRWHRSTSGTTWNARSNKWQAQVSHAGTCIYIGVYSSRDEAMDAVRAKRVTLGHGSPTQ